MQTKESKSIALERATSVLDDMIQLHESGAPNVKPDCKCLMHLLKIAVKQWAGTRKAEDLLRRYESLADEMSYKFGKKEWAHHAILGWLFRVFLCIF